MNTEEDEKPISSYIQNPRKTDGMVTLVDKLLLPRWLVRIIVPESDEMKLLYVILGMIIMFSIWGAWDFGACHERNPECTFIECFSHNEPQLARRHK